MNNPNESAPRKVFKNDDVLVEELFVLPEAHQLLRAIGFQEENNWYFYGQTNSDELAEMHEMLTRKREVITESHRRELASLPFTQVESAVEAHRREKEAAMQRIQEQLELDRREKQRNPELIKAGPVRPTNLSQCSGMSQMEEDDRDDCISVINDDQIKALASR